MLALVVYDVIIERIYLYCHVEDPMGQRIQSFVIGCERRKKLFSYGLGQNKKEEESQEGHSNLGEEECGHSCEEGMHVKGRIVASGRNDAGSSLAGGTSSINGTITTSTTSVTFGE